MGLTALWIRNKYTGKVHKIGDDIHDSLYVDDNGTLHYFNTQNGDGCIGYHSVNRTTVAEVYPDSEKLKEQTDVYLHGYEFVPNQDDLGYPTDPTNTTP